MLFVQIALHVLTFLSHVPNVLMLNSSTKEFKPQARMHQVVIIVIDFHYRNVDFVLFHNVARYTNSLLSCIHVNTTYLLNITCTLVATCLILGC